MRPLGAPVRCVGALLLAASIGAKPGGHHEPLSLRDIHFIVMSSEEVMERALWVNHTWCSYEQASCVFASPRRICSSIFGGCLKTMLVSGQAPKNCCQERSFFCLEHRAQTLNAQYRFLPALYEYTRSEAYASAKWVVLVDDDAFVFVENLRRHLEHFPTHVPLYMGEFLEGSGWSFVCGGGGSVLSRAAMDRMNLHQCIKQVHPKCMQSDWMIAECAHRAKVRFIKEHGCNTCSHINKRRAHNVIHTLLPRCHFMQQAALFLPYMAPQLNGVPSIIHGFRTEAHFRKVMQWFRHTHPSNGSWTAAPVARPLPGGLLRLQPGAAGGEGGEGARRDEPLLTVISDEEDRRRAGGGAAGARTGGGGAAAAAEEEDDDDDEEDSAEDSGQHNINARDQEQSLREKRPW